MSIEIEHILYPTDFSDNAREALPYALELACQTGATVHIMHSIEEPYDFAPMAQDVKKGVDRKVEKLLHEMIDDITKEEKYASLDIKTHIQTGRTIYAVLEEAQNSEADLIVMGTKGRSGFAKIFLGSTTAEVIQLSDIPVLAIPEEASFSGIKEILFATDYQERDLEALRYLAELAKLWEAKITVFHAAMGNHLKNEILFRGFREMAKESIGYSPIDFERAPSKDFFETIKDKISMARPSAVAMVRYKDPFSLFGKKHSKEMSYSVEKPLLVIPGDIEFYKKLSLSSEPRKKKEIEKQPVESK